MTTAVPTGWLIGIIPVWSVLLALVVLGEGLGRRKLADLGLGFLEVVALLGTVNCWRCRRLRRRRLFGLGVSVLVYVNRPGVGLIRGVPALPGASGHPRRRRVAPR